MDMRAYYIQAAEAAAAAVHDEDDDVLELTPKGVLLKLDAQVTAEAPAPRKGGGLAEAAGKASEGDSGGGRDLRCPECGKTFLSDKAMYGHLRSHPERGYKGATRPATAGAAAAAGDKKPRKKAPRKEAELPATNVTATAATARETKWPLTEKRGRAPPSTPSAGSAPVAAVPSSSCGSAEEEAAMILLEMAYRGSTSETQQPMVSDHVARNQMPELLQLMSPDHVASAVVAHQMPEAEQNVQLELVPQVIAESRTPEVTKPLETPTEAVVAVVRDKSTPADQQAAAPGSGAKKHKKRRLLDPEQAPRAASPEAADANTPARGIPSPASDKKHECLICGKSFPTYQALGGHMSSHTKVSSSRHGARHDDPAVVQAMHNILSHHKQSSSAVTGGADAAAGVGQECQDVQPPPSPPPVAQSPPQHVCPDCYMTFPSGQALGGHKRKHWFPEKRLARAALAAAAPRDFDLNELPVEDEGDNQH